MNLKDNYTVTMHCQKLYQSALNYLNEGKLVLAANVCTEILRIQPNNYNSMNLLGIIFYQLGKDDIAIECFKNAIQLKPDYADGYNNLGTTLQKKGQFDEAIAYHQKALQLNPNLVEAYNNLGVALREKGQFGDAIAYHQKALQLDPNLAKAYENLAIAFQEKGQINTSSKCFQKSIQLDPIFEGIKTPIFINKKKDTLLFINLKCGYTTLKYYKRQGKVNIWESGNWEQYYRIALVRNPCKRIESFYKDKLIKTMNPGLGQICQKRLNCFFPKNRLINKEISFEEFVSAIDRGYQDDHIIPQHKNIPKEIDYIVHLENKEEHKIIEERFNIEFIKTMSTEDIKLELVWSDEMKEIIKRHYYEDFYRFGYDF